MCLGNKYLPKRYRGILFSPEVEERFCHDESFLLNSPFIRSVHGFVHHAEFASVHTSIDPTFKCTIFVLRFSF